MADKLIRAIVSIPASSGVPEDIITNTWHFDGDDGNTDVEYSSTVMTLLTNFYQAVDSLFAPMIGTTATVRLYDLRDATPRVPWHTGTIALTTAVATPTLPREAAICLSYQADVQSGQNQARRRGRIYLGPISGAACSFANGDVRPTNSTLTTIANAASNLEDGLALGTTGNMKWAVYSPTTDALGTIDDAFHDVTNGWVDNALDTVRSRGRDADSRALWT